MIVAIIGSRSLNIPNLEEYLPDDVTEIVSGSAKGIDACAREYAHAHDLKLTEFLPEYSRYKKGAPLRRNIKIIEYADCVITFWDRISKGTKFVIEQCTKRNIPLKTFLMKSS